MKSCDRSQILFKTLYYSGNVEDQFEQIIEDCQRKNIKYKDPDFYPQKSLIEEDKELFREHEWRRIEDQYPSNIYENISTESIQQGKLGDCYLIVSFIYASQHPELIRTLFHPKSSLQYGCVLVYFYFLGERLPVIIDTQIAYQDSYSKNPLFSHPKTNNDSCWFVLIEKAFAKACGGYKYIISGSSHIAMRLLFDYYSSSQSKIENLIPKKSLKEEKEKVENLNEKIFDFFLELIEKKAMVSTNISEKNSHKINDNIGLMSEHAYQVIKVCESENIQFIKLRNPWGIGKFEGQINLTKKNKEDLNYSEIDDGSFWMPLSGYFYYFDSVCFSLQREKEWKEMNVYGQIEGYLDGRSPCTGDAHVGCIPQWSIKFTKKTVVRLSYDVSSPDSFFSIYIVKNKGRKVDFILENTEIERTTASNSDVNGIEYIVEDYREPFTFFFNRTDKREEPCYFRILIQSPDSNFTVKKFDDNFITEKWNCKSASGFFNSSEMDQWNPYDSRPLSTCRQWFINFPKLEKNEETELRIRIFKEVSEGPLYLLFARTDERISYSYSTLQYSNFIIESKSEYEEFSIPINSKYLNLLEEDKPFNYVFSIYRNKQTDINKFKFYVLSKKDFEFGLMKQPDPIHNCSYSIKSCLDIGENDGASPYDIKKPLNKLKQWCLIFKKSPTTLFVEFVGKSITSIHHIFLEIRNKPGQKIDCFYQNTIHFDFNVEVNCEHDQAIWEINDISRPYALCVTRNEASSMSTFDLNIFGNNEFDLYEINDDDGSIGKKASHFNYIKDYYYYTKENYFIDFPEVEFIDQPINFKPPKLNKPSQSESQNEKENNETDTNVYSDKTRQFHTFIVKSDSDYSLNGDNQNPTVFIQRLRSDEKLDLIVKDNKNSTEMKKNKKLLESDYSNNKKNSDNSNQIDADLALDSNLTETKANNNQGSNSRNKNNYRKKLISSDQFTDSINTDDNKLNNDDKTFKNDTTSDNDNETSKDDTTLNDDNETSKENTASNNDVKTSKDDTTSNNDNDQSNNNTKSSDEQPKDGVQILNNKESNSSEPQQQQNSNNGIGDQIDNSKQNTEVKDNTTTIIKKKEIPSINNNDTIPTTKEENSLTIPTHKHNKKSSLKKVKTYLSKHNIPFTCVIKIKSLDNKKKTKQFFVLSDFCFIIMKRESKRITKTCKESLLNVASISLAISNIIIINLDHNSFLETIELQTKCPNLFIESFNDQIKRLLTSFEIKKINFDNFVMPKSLFKCTPRNILFRFNSLIKMNNIKASEKFIENTTFSIHSNSNSYVFSKYKKRKKIFPILFQSVLLNRHINQIKIEKPDHIYYLLFEYIEYFENICHIIIEGPPTNDLISFIKKSKNINSLSFSNYLIDNFYSISVLIENDRIHSIGFDSSIDEKKLSNFITIPSFRKLSYFRVTNLKEIDIVSCAICFTNLTVLSLKSCNLLIGKVIETMSLYQFDYLKELDLSGNFGTGFSFKQKKLNLLNQLKTLFVDDVKWDLENLIFFMNLCKESSLTLLSINNIMFVNSFEKEKKMKLFHKKYKIENEQDEWVNLFNNLPNRLNSISSLNWNSNKIDNKLIDFLLNSNELTHISFTSCHITNLPYIKRLLINSKIQSVIISKLKTDKENSDLIQFKEFLFEISNMKSLRKILITKNNLDNECFEILANSLIKSNVDLLSFDGSNVKSSNDLFKFCEVLKKSKKKSIQISFPIRDVQRLKMNQNEIDLLNRYIYILSRPIDRRRKLSPYSIVPENSIPKLKKSFPQFLSKKYLLEDGKERLKKPQIKQNNFIEMSLFDTTSYNSEENSELFESTTQNFSNPRKLAATQTNVNNVKKDISTETNQPKPQIKKVPQKKSNDSSENQNKKENPEINQEDKNQIKKEDKKEQQQQKQPEKIEKEEEEDYSYTYSYSYSDYSYSSRSEPEPNRKSSVNDQQDLYFTGLYYDDLENMNNTATINRTKTIIFVDRRTIISKVDKNKRREYDSIYSNSKKHKND